MNELKDTIELMNSSDYKDRFKAEYISSKSDTPNFMQCL